MNRHRYITLVLTSLLISFSSSGQSHPYAKFDSGGQIIGLFNLSEKRSGCRDRRSMNGSVRSFRIVDRDDDTVVSFTFDSGGSRRFVTFTLLRDAIPRPEIENLLSTENRSRVTACLNDGRWIAEEITKQEGSK